MNWAASKAVGHGSRRRALRALICAVLANLLQFEPYRGHRVAASPEVFSGGIPLLVFGRDCDAHVYVVRHRMPLLDLAFLLYEATH